RPSISCAWDGRHRGRNGGQHEAREDPASSHVPPGPIALCLAPTAPFLFGRIIPSGISVTFGLPPYGPSAVHCGPLLGLLLLLAGSQPVAAREVTTPALLQRRVASGEPGLALLVRRAGRTVFERGYGVRDLRGRMPIDARTDFRLAS